MSPAKNTATNSDGFTKAEQAAMKERAKELKKEAKVNQKKEEGEQDIFDKIDEMSEPDKSMAKRIHEIVTENAPDLWPKTWYGMPAYAIEGKQVVCFFQGKEKFEARYASLGFNDSANLDDGDIWATAFAIVALTPAVEKKIAELVKKAIS